MCACMSQRSGIRNLPRPSTTRAPVGGAPFCATLLIVWPLIVTVLFDTIRPFTTSTTLTPVIASDGVCAVIATVAIRVAAKIGRQAIALRLDLAFLMADPDGNGYGHSRDVIQPPGVLSCHEV